MRILGSFSWEHQAKEHKESKNLHHARSGFRNRDNLCNIRVPEILTKE